MRPVVARCDESEDDDDDDDDSDADDEEAVAAAPKVRAKAGYRAGPSASARGGSRGERSSRAAKPAAATKPLRPQPKGGAGSGRRPSGGMPGGMD